MIELDNQYWTIEYDEVQKTVICGWKEGVGDLLTDDIFKEEMSSYVEIVEKYQAPKLLLNLRQSNYTVVPEVQEWVAHNIAPRAIKAGQRKIATLLSEELFAQVATQQLMEEGIISTIEQQYFDDLEEAKAWLFEDE